MKSSNWLSAGLLYLLLSSPSLMAQELRTDGFPPIDLIETELKRGVSTTSDVESVLGKPTGYGGYLAIMDGIPRDVWYYHDINSTMIDTKDSVMRMHTHIQVLLIFLSNDRFDGYKWFAASAPARATTRREEQ